VDQLIALRRRQHINPTNRQIRIHGHHLKHPDKPIGQRLDAGRIEQVRAVVQAQVQVRGGADNQGEGVVGGVAAGDPGDV
jgi:ribosomal protein S6E (S10)